MIAALNVIGLLANLAGVILLFRYGMPYRVASPEGDFFITEKPSPEGQMIDRRYKILGFLGLGFILVGTGLQILAALI